MAVDQETLRRRRRAREAMARRSRRFAPATPPPAQDLDPVPAPAGRGRRAQLMALSGLIALVGVWLVAAPWVLGYPAREPRWNDVIVGVIVLVLAVGSAAARPLAHRGSAAA